MDPPPAVAAVAPPNRERVLLEAVDEALALRGDADWFIRAGAREESARGEESRELRGLIVERSEGQQRGAAR